MPTIARPVLARVSLAALVLVAAPAAAEAPRPFTARDLVTMEQVSGVAVSPGGDRVAHVVRTTDLEANARNRDLWLVDVAGGEPRRLTTDAGNDDTPVWAPDGRSLFFLSTRSGSSQVWRLPTDGGEAARVTDLPVAVDAFAVSPDGALLAVSLEVYLDCADLACTEERLAEVAESPATGHLYERLFVRHWDRFEDGRRSHLFVVPVDGSRPPVDVSAGLVADVPSKPFGDAAEFTFTPDGREVVFTARVAGAEEPWSTNFDLWAAPVDGSAPARNLTDANDAWDTHPVFSPDDATLAYLAMARPGYEADRFRLVLRDWATGATRVLTEAWDRSVGDFAFSADGATIWATATDLGHVSLFSVDVATGAVERVFRGGHVRSPQPAAGHRLVFGLDTLTSPVELHALHVEDGTLAQLTHHNREELAGVELGAPEAFSFPGWNGETVHGWLVRPASFAEGKRYPLAFLIHGGPQGSFGNDFHYRWNPQVYAGAGYAAVAIDFHGSTGYGQAFTDSIRGDWGGKPLVDLQKGLAWVLERHPWIDGARACALGASYGGYMINWIAGNWPDAFRCLVNHDGVLDQRSMYFTTEELWFPEWEHGGPYWAAREGFERHNPVDHVEKWKTPMLVVHGALDYRVPETQGIAAFTALQRRGVPSQLLHFPDENHWVLQPHNSLQWHDTVLAWLDRWTAEAGD